VNGNEASVATLEPASETSSAGVLPGCEKCGAAQPAGMVAICRNCGWYPSLNMFVEVDREWELATEASAQPAAAVSTKSHPQILLELIPRWGWVMIASVFVVIAESVAARLLTPAGSSLRTLWSLAQLFLGGLVATVCHIINFLALTSDDAEIGALDLVMKPIRLWVRGVAHLPARLWVANSAACGLVAAVMSVLVIGGLPYERLWDWGFKEPPKQNLMGAVMDRAKKLDGGSSDSLEEAVSDFAGSQDITGEEVKKPEPPKPRLRIDGVILGYQTDRDGRLSGLLLGAVHRGKLAYAGQVTPKLSDEELTELLESLQAIPAKQAFLHIEATANWVQPKYTCRVTFSEQLSNGRLRDMEWTEMLGTMGSP
jgi:hypothetical protein